MGGTATSYAVAGAFGGVVGLVALVCNYAAIGVWYSLATTDRWNVDQARLQRVSNAVITIDDDSSVPPYEQLRAQLAFRVRAGHVVAGERLPTVRQLAGDLGLARNTVVRAYRELEAAGLVIGDGRRGTVVTSRPNNSDDRTSLIDEAAARFLAELAVLQPSLDELVAALRRVSGT